MAKPKKPQPWLYICAACAQARGGVWPPGDAATCHQGECDLCGQRRTLAAAGDWNWPRGSDLKQQEANRD